MVKPSRLSSTISTPTGPGRASIWCNSHYRQTLYQRQHDQTITGTVGNDIYVYDRGDGNDTITDAGGEDQLHFGSDILVSNVTFRKTGNDLIVTISDDDTATADNTITITNWTVEANRIEEFIFDDGTIKTDEAILDII